MRVRVALPTLHASEPSMPSNATHCPCAAQRGVTLIEAMFTVVLLGTLVVLAAPSMQRIVQTRWLHGTAANIATLLHHARAAAIARQERTSVSLVARQGGGTCQLVHTGSSRDCVCSAPAAAQCTGTATLIAASHLPDPSRLIVSSTAASIHFDPRAGTATPAGRFVIRTPNGREIQTVVGLTGRVRSCAVGPRELGYAPCPPS